MSSHLKIVLATDDGFAMHTACLIVSILKNAEADQDFTFYVLDGGITDESKAKIESLKSVRHFEIQYLVVNPQLLENLPGLRWGMNTLSRLLIPELLPHEDRLLYLDADMIVRGSLEELWTADFEGKAIAVALDICELSSDSFNRDWRKTVLGLSNSKMFNAGMMLMNMKKIREEHSFQTTMQWLEHFANVVLFPDQDALNVIFRDDKKIISSKWNTPSLPNVQPCCSEPPVVVHYCTKKKPSSYLYPGLYREEYWQNLRMTPWKDFQPTDYSWKKAFKKFLLKKLGLSCLIQFMAERILKYSPWLQEVFTDREHQKNDAWKLRLLVRELTAKNTRWEAYFQDAAPNKDESE